MLNRLKWLEWILLDLLTYIIQSIMDMLTLSMSTYICLFTCASTHAIHLELATDITSEIFLKIFRRFVVLATDLQNLHRRSVPRESEKTRTPHLSCVGKNLWKYPRVHYLRRLHSHSTISVCEVN